MIIFSDIHLDYPSFNYDIHNHKHLKELINNKLWIAPITINNITPYVDWYIQLVDTEGLYNPIKI